MPGAVQTSAVYSGKVKAGIHILMAFCSNDEKNMFSLFYFGRYRKTPKKDVKTKHEPTTWRLYRILRQFFPLGFTFLKTDRYISLDKIELICKCC